MVVWLLLPAQEFAFVLESGPGGKLCAGGESVM
jgi:hypothetical protein